MDDTLSKYHVLVYHFLQSTISKQHGKTYYTFFLQFLHGIKILQQSEFKLRKHFFFVTAMLDTHKSSMFLNNLLS